MKLPLALLPLLIVYIVEVIYLKFSLKKKNAKNRQGEGSFNSG